MVPNIKARTLGEVDDELEQGSDSDRDSDREDCEVSSKSRKSDRPCKCLKCRRSQKSTRAAKVYTRRDSRIDCDIDSYGDPDSEKEECGP